MAVATEINRVIAAADAKAGFLLAAQGVVLVGSAAGAGGATSPVSGLRIVAVLLSGAGVVLLLLALWPRITGSSPWLAFPALHVDDAARDRPAQSDLANQAWTQAGTLAGIARRKHGWFRAALIAGTGGVLTFAGSILPAVLS